MDITEILRRYHSGKSIRSINRETGYDRATIKKYIDLAVRKGITADVKYTTEELLELFTDDLNQNERTSEKIELLEKYIEEFRKLVTDKSNPLKPKSAFEVLSERYLLTGIVSYSTFKRFAKTFGISRQGKQTTCRVEIPVASQIQIDYAFVGYLTVADERKKVYAFIGTLGYSRHKYVEFVYTQSQQSFVQSNVNMLNFFGGVTETLRLDNLKSGVIKSDRYDPRLNRAFAEMALYYGIFIDPCRVATPKDKPVVERDVQTVREEFRKMLAVNPMVTISEVNIAITNWSVNKYGMKKHGTTQQKPFQSFTEEEKPLLKALPAEEYEVAEWKEAKVHPDHYIQVNMKRYSLPGEYIGKKVWVKVTNKLIYAYYNDRLIKQHTIPNGYRQTDIEDFPDNMKHVLDSGMPLYLITKADAVSAEFGKLITRVLSPNAYINMRRAQSIVGLADKYPAELIAEASKSAIEHYGKMHPKLFISVIEKIQSQRAENEQPILISENTSGMVRSIEYFIHNN